VEGSSRVCVADSPPYSWPIASVHSADEAANLGVASALSQAQVGLLRQTDRKPVALQSVPDKRVEVQYAQSAERLDALRSMIQLREGPLKTLRGSGPRPRDAQPGLGSNPCDAQPKPHSRAKTASDGDAVVMFKVSVAPKLVEQKIDTEPNLV